jgi:glycosyltransferase involved in cell wall biosynthesis
VPAKRRVLYFTDARAFGGAESALLTLLAGLDRDQWQATLVCPWTADTTPLLEGAHALGAAVWPIDPLDAGPTVARLIAFGRRIRAARPDIFHAHLSWPLACRHGLATAIGARVPVIVATEHLYFDVDVGTRTALVQRVLARGIDAYIAVSRATAAALAAALPIPAGKIRVVHNGIPVKSFASPSTHPDVANPLRNKEDRPVVLAVGRLHEQKGHRFLVDAASAIPVARFAVAGDGPDRASLETQVHASGLQDRFTFLGARRDISHLLAACDVFVLASLYEGLPLSVLEAMAAGKPVVATRVGGVEEAIVDGATGLLVRSGNAGELAAAIRWILADPQRARAMGEAGRERVNRHFTADRMVSKTVDLYEQLWKSARAHRTSG